MNENLDDIFWNTTIWELEVNLTKACGNNKGNRILIADYIKPGLDPKHGDYDLIHDGLKTGAVLEILIYQNLSFFFILLLYQIECSE